MDNIWQFINNNIAWIMGGFVFFTGIALIIIWNKFFNVLIKAGKEKPT